MYLRLVFLLLMFGITQISLAQDGGLKLSNNDFSRWEDTIYLKNYLSIINSHSLDTLFIAEVMTFKKWVDSAQNSSLTIKSHFTIATFFHSIGLIDLSLSSLKRGISIATTRHDSSFLSHAQPLMAELYWQKGVYDSAVHFYKNVISLAITTEDKLPAMANLAILYEKLGDYTNALLYNNQSYKLLEITIQSKNASANDSLQLAGLLLNIAKLHLIMHLSDDALDFYKQACFIAERIGDQEMILWGQMGVADVYAAKKQLPLAISTIIAAIKVSEGKIGKNPIMCAKNALAKAYLDSDQPQLALKTADEALLLCDNEESYAAIQLVLGNVAIRLRNWIDARKSLEATLRIANTSHDLPTAIDAYKSLAVVYENLGLKDSTIHALKAYTQLKDSIYSTEKANELIRVDLQEDFSRKQISDSLRQTNMYALKMEKQTLLTNYSLVGIALLLLLSFFIFRSYSIQKKYNALLASEKVAHLARIKEQKDVLTDIAYTQSHYIRGPVSTLLGLAQILNTDDPTDPQNKQTLNDIVEVTHRIDAIVTEVVKKENNVSQNKTFDEEG